MALKTGSAYVELEPKLAAGFGSKVGEQVDPEVEKSGDKAGGKWAKAFAAAGLAAGAVLGKSFADSLNIDAGTDKIAASLGLTEATAKVAGEAASNLYKGAWGGSMEEVQDAIASVGSTLLDMNKVSQGELEKTTANALDMANAFGIDVDRAVNSTGILLKTGLAGNATEAMDLITATLQGVPKAVREDILDASDEYSTYFKNLGLSGVQSMGILKDASKGGAIQIDKVGDALKELTIRSTDMSESTKASYQAMGLNIDQMALKFAKGGKDSGEALQQVASKLLSIKDPVAQSNAAIGIFGTQIEDIGRENMPGFLQALAGGESSLKGFEGSTERMSNTLNGNAKTNLESFKRQALMGITDFIGGTVIPKFTEFSTEISSKLGDKTDEVKNVVVGAVAAMALAVGIHMATIVAGWVAAGAAATWNAAKMVAGWVASAAAALASGATTAAIAALYVAEWLAMAAGAVAGAAKTVASWVATAASAVAAGAVMAAQVALQVAKWILLGATSLAQAALVAAAWLISMGPIVLVIAAVVGLVALIIANWDTVVEATKKAWNWVWDKVKEVGQGIKDIATGFANFVKDVFLNWTAPGLIIKHWDDIKEGARKAFDWITDKVDAVIRFFGGVKGRISSATSGMWNGLQDAFRGAINWIIDKWNAFELRIPEVDTHIPGVGKVGGFSIGTPDIPRFEKGGRGTGTFIAGEKGPELINVGRNVADITNNDDTMKMLAEANRIVERHYHYHNESKLEDPLVDQFREMQRLALPI